MPSVNEADLAVPLDGVGCASCARPGFGTKLIKGTLPPRPAPPCLLRSLLDYNPKYTSQIYGGTSLLFLAHRKLEDFVRFIETGEQETPDPDATPEGEGHDEL